MSADTHRTLPPVRKDIVTGIDVGGTKVHIVDTLDRKVRRYRTADYSDLETILEEYFQAINARPAKIAVGMAGPRNDETGEVKLTNTAWSAFNPAAAAEKYGIRITTANDMVAGTAGVLQDRGIDFVSLKPGAATRTGTRLVVALSTGIGSAAAVWDSRAGRYVIAAGEGGHIGIEPKNEAEQGYLAYLQTKYPHVSAELALSGKFGIENLVDYRLEADTCRKLQQAIADARAAGRPVGAVLLGFATEGEGADRRAAEALLQQMGAMIGSVIRDLAVVHKATGGIYIMGSVGLALGEYFAANTAFTERFVCRGAVHDTWLEKVPISLVLDPHIAVAGALALANGM